MPNTRKCGHLDSWEAFESFANEMHTFGRVSAPVMVFRGHSKERGNLNPTLARGLSKFPQHHVNAETTEMVIRLEVLARAGETELSNVADEDRFSQETILRHYGAPSRLLDWTHSPFVALYFACAHDYDTDGEIWCASSWAVNDAANISATLIPPSDLSNWFDYSQGTSRVAFIRPKRHSQRSAAQQCLFSISNNPRADHKGLIEHATQEAIRDKTSDWDGHLPRRHIVPAKCKHDFLKRLMYRNVHAGALFPDLDGLCRFAGDLLTLYPWDLENAIRVIRDREIDRGEGAPSEAT